MSRVIASVRVSTREQADSGLGLAAQRATIQAEATRRGWDDVIWVEDAGYTASNLRRPGLQRALAMLAAGEADALVVARLDRLSRSLLDFAGVVEASRREGWALHCLDVAVDTSTPAGELLANVMASFAMFERRIIQARTTDALAAARARGVRLGGPITTPAAVREQIVALAATGLSHAAIARALNAEGVPTASGGTWHRSGVRRVLRSHALDLAAAEARTSQPTSKEAA
ncbi:MAG: recombinase family protein [Actinomycetota bacterium]|nr:recombinase family protein [Actinomycetota bacterium]